MILAWLVVGILGCGGKAKFQVGELSMTVTSPDLTPSAHADDPVCAAGMTLIQPSNHTSFCIDSVSRHGGGRVEHSAATTGCLGAGNHVCSAQQMLSACAAGKIDDHVGSTYWTQDITFNSTHANPYAVVILTSPGTGCNSVPTTAMSNLPSSQYDNYCCSE